MGDEWSASRPGRALPQGERIPGTHCTGGWVGRRASLDTEVREKISCLRRGSNPDRPVRSQTLYWLSYPGSSLYKHILMWTHYFFRRFVSWLNISTADWHYYAEIKQCGWTADTQNVGSLVTDEKRQTTHTDDTLISWQGTEETSGITALMNTCQTNDTRWACRQEKRETEQGKL
jgi:hypothetical protein